MPDICYEEKIRAYSRKRNLWGRGKGKQNLILGDRGSWRKKCRVGYARGGVKKNSRRGGVVEVKKKTREGCLMHSYSLDKCKGGMRLRKKELYHRGRG